MISHIYYAHWWQNVTDRATVTKWAVNFRPRFCNALAVEYKYSDSLSINEAHNYKRKSSKSEKYTQILYKNHSPVCFSLKSFSLTDLSIEGGLVIATPTCYSSTQFVLQVFLQQRWPQSLLCPFATTRSSIIDFFCIISLAPFVGNVNQSSYLSQWQKSSSKYEMEAETAQ